MTINKVTITRLLKTAKDFDAVGLIIISYYLRLYLVEKILNEVNRPEELTELASNLLDSIEQFKTGVLASDDNDGENNVKLLINDQDKAKVYFINFAMNLYNQKLEQLSKVTDNQNKEENVSISGNNNVEQDLKRGFWCCIDLFETTLHMWNFDSVPENSGGIEEQQQQRQLIQKRLKYCKLYLSKIAKGKLNNEANGKVIESSPETLHPKKDNYKEEQSNSIEDEQKMQEKKEKGGKVGEIIGQETGISNGEHDDDINEEHNSIDGIDNGDSNFQLPPVPTDVPDRKLELINSDVDSEYGIEHKTLEYEEETKCSNGDTSLDEVQSHHYDNHRQYSKNELVEMMDQASKIEKIQKLAKYAISALNYEDIVTAKDQLKDALDLLNTL